jgi:TolA-binding protein
MKAEVLRQLIREVLAEQESQPEDQQATKLKTGSMSASQRVKSSRERITDTSGEFTPQEQKIVDQLEKFIADLAATEGIDLLQHRTFLEKAMKQIEKRLVKEGHGHHLAGGLEDDGHEVEMALSDLHKLEKYAPQVAQLASQYSDLPGWVQSKITLSADYLGKVYHYLDGKQHKGME